MSRITRDRRQRRHHRLERMDGSAAYDVVRHLDMILTTIDRMANNSFLLKGWSVTLAAGLFALAANDAKPLFAAIAVLPGIAFWGLDAYYLRQERLFRSLYNAVRGSSQAADPAIEPYSLSTTPFQSTVPSWFQTLWARSVLAVHGVVLLAIVTVITYLLIAG